MRKSDEGEVGETGDWESRSQTTRRSKRLGIGKWESWVKRGSERLETGTWKSDEEERRDWRSGSEKIGD